MKRIFQVKGFILSIILITISFESYSEKVDSLIFNNNFESKIFNDFKNNKNIDPLDIFISIDYTSKSELIKVRLIDFYNSLEKGGFKDLSEKKQIKEIYRKVHSTFLQKYSEEVLFSDVFNSGNYNCVTASALYSIILHHFNIDFLIKRTPIHVYLVADPHGEQVAIETTSPTKGLIAYDDRFKKSYVDYLRQNKLISETEYTSKTIDELFENRYQKDVTINTIQLAAIQYYNKSIVLFNSHDYKESLKCLEKAELLYSDNSIKFMKNNVLVNLLSEQANNKKFNGITLAKYLNTNKKSSLSNEYVSDYFNTASKEQVINHPNISGYTQFFNEFIQTISDSINKEDYYQIFNELLGYYYYSNSDYKNALVYYGNSYKYNPDNIQTKQMIYELVYKTSITNSDIDAKIDSLELNIDKFPFLKTNSSFQQYLIICYFNAIINYYEKGNPKRGEEFLTRFEKCVKERDFLGANNELISSIYQQISSIYYRLHYYEDQEDILKRGLHLLPESEVLKTNLNSLQSSKSELIEWGKKNNLSSRSKPYSLDDESIEVLKSIANKKRNIINSNIDKYLKIKVWRLENVVVKNSIVSLSPKEQVCFVFDKENIAKIKDSKGESTGSWSYNRSESTIRIFDSKDSATTNIMIYEIDSTLIKSIMFNDNKPTKIITFLKSL